MITSLERPQSFTGSTGRQYLVDNRFQVNDLIGRGATSNVYRATHVDLGQEVALKIMINISRKDSSALQRFFQEAKLLAALSHPSIVKVHAYGVSSGSPYMAMDLVAGESLQQLLLRRRPQLEEIIRWGEMIASAMAVVHDAGIVHRDIKPSNIMLTGPLAERLPIVVDFGSGLALSSSNRLTNSQMIVGTPIYMSPEQFDSSSVDYRSDIYSLGCVLYEMLTGQEPFSATNYFQTALAHHHQAPPALPKSTPHWLSELIMKMLQKAPAERPESMHRVAECFREQACEQGRATKTTISSKWRSQLKRIMSKVALAMVMALVMLGCALACMATHTPASVVSFARARHLEDFKTASDTDDVLSCYERALDSNRQDALLSAEQRVHCLERICSRTADSDPRRCFELAARAIQEIRQGDLSWDKDLAPCCNHLRRAALTLNCSDQAVPIIRQANRFWIDHHSGHAQELQQNLARTFFESGQFHESLLIAQQVRRETDCVHVNDMDWLIRESRWQLSHPDQAAKPTWPGDHIPQAKPENAQEIYPCMPGLLIHLGKKIIPTSN